jgi:ubiquinone/menaquinone biosynthesis C-methylase UbiE
MTVSRSVLGIFEYDGCHLPFADASFDLIFSSHVMEHVQDQESIHREMLRTLRPDGRSVHVVPTATWRVYDSILYYPSKVLRLSGCYRLSARMKRMTSTPKRTRQTIPVSRCSVAYSMPCRDTDMENSGTGLRNTFISGESMEATV